MNTRTIFQYPAIGALTHGGYFHNVVLLDGKLWGEVTGPKAECEVSGLVWHPEYTDVPTTDFDSVANTQAMAEAGSPLGQAALACRAGGFDDWAVPSRGSQLMQWAMRGALDASGAFDAKWYWSSTQLSRDDACIQYFGYGYTFYNFKDWQGGSVRFVRRTITRTVSVRGPGAGLPRLPRQQAQHRQRPAV